MTVTAVPAFDVQALRQWAEIQGHPPVDEHELRVLWNQLIGDLLAAADEIDRLEERLAA